MAKRGFSSGLQAMKFMQRGRLKEEAAKIEAEKEKEVDEDHWVAPAQNSGRCVVIMEGDPRPGAAIGRMSFQSYNPNIDKLQEEIETRRVQLRTSATSSSRENTKSHEKVKPSTVAEEDTHPASRENLKSDEGHPRKKLKVEPAAEKSSKQSQVQVDWKKQGGGKTSQNRFDIIQAGRGFRKPPEF